MTELFSKCMFLSAQTGKELIIYKNPAEGNVQVFVFIEIIHKTSNTPYHEMLGKEITDEFAMMNTQAFDVNSFEQRLRKKMKISIKSPENNWLWLKAEPGEAY